MTHHNYKTVMTQILYRFYYIKFGTLIILRRSKLALSTALTWIKSSL